MPAFPRKRRRARVAAGFRQRRRSAALSHVLRVAAGDPLARRDTDGIVRMRLGLPDASRFRGRKRLVMASVRRPAAEADGEIRAMLRGSDPAPVGGGERAVVAGRGISPVETAGEIGRRVRVDEPLQAGPEDEDRQCMTHRMLSPEFTCQVASVGARCGGMGTINALLPA